MDFIRKYTNAAWEFYEDQPAVALALAGISTWLRKNFTPADLITLFAAIVVVSVVMVLFLCCIGSSGSKNSRAPMAGQRKTVGERKKQDETEADDVASDGSPSSEPVGADAPDIDSAGKPKKKGSRKAD